MKLYDAHNHLQDPSIRAQLPQIAVDLAEIGLGAAIVNGIAEDDWADVAAMSETYPFIIPSFGVHPWYVGNRSPEALQTLRERLIENPHGLIGETGLNKWMPERARPDDWRLRGLRLAPIPEQMEILRAEIALAVELARPITIHCVRAWGPLLEILRNVPLPKRGILFHAYSGAAELLPELTKMGGYFSFNGRFLEERHHERRDTFRFVAPDRLLVETDAPEMVFATELSEFALPPDAEGHRLNHPGNLRAAYRGLADLLGENIDELAARLENNFWRFAGI